MRAYFDEGRQGAWVSYLALPITVWNGLCVLETCHSQVESRDTGGSRCHLSVHALIAVYFKCDEVSRRRARIRIAHAWDAMRVFGRTPPWGGAEKNWSLQVPRLEVWENVLNELLRLRSEGVHAISCGSAALVRLLWASLMRKSLLLSRLQFLDYALFDALSLHANGKWLKRCNIFIPINVFTISVESFWHLVHTISCGSALVRLVVARLLRKLSFLPRFHFADRVPYMMQCPPTQTKSDKGILFKLFLFQ